MNILEATERYERWLSKQTAIVAKDLRKKKEKMAQHPFPFFRGTFYRWVQLWPQLSTDFSEAPSVRCVGDLHLENFGTWRDAEGRLIWGVNDFDEAYRLPYVFDLVRLVASIILARQANILTVDPVAGCERILSGYRESFAASGKPFVLAEAHPELREMALKSLANPITFWQKVEEEKNRKESTDISNARKRASKILKQSLSMAGPAVKVLPRVAGVGSLGRPRFVAIAEWNGGRIAREAKALVPSACVWLAGIKPQPESLYETMVNRAVRMPDPFVEIHKRWIVRRIAPDCVRIEAGGFQNGLDEPLLLNAMGWETANIHLGTLKSRQAVTHHLKKLQDDSLFAVAERMVEATVRDWEEFTAIKGRD
ncbi:MAG: DUF2252 family protein [Rubrivivax sp.]|nr:DUF2252 family protein [Pyrinomonadaceae bacterium]